MRYDLKLERRLPYFLGFFSGIVAAVVVCLFQQPELPRAVPAATMTAGIVVSSFTATQRNMLLGMNASIVLRRLAASNYHFHVMDYLKQTIWFGMATTTVSLIGLFIDGNSYLASIWLVALVFTVVAIIVSTIRNEHMIFLIVKKFLNEQKANNPDKSTRK